MAKVSDIEIPSLLFDEQASAPTTPATGFWRAYFKSDGLYVVDDAGTETGPFGTGSGSGGVTTTKARRTAGDVSVNTTGWQNVDTGIDLTLAAVAGDEIEYTISLYCNSANNALKFDVATIVSGSPVNYFGGAGGADSGVPGWWAPASQDGGISGGVLYTVQAGDISGGNVVLRLRVNPANTTARIIAASSATPLIVSAKNLG